MLFSYGGQWKRNGNWVQGSKCRVGLYGATTPTVENQNGMKAESEIETVVFQYKAV